MPSNLAQLACAALLFAALAYQARAEGEAQPAPGATQQVQGAEYFFFNSNSGKSQWEDPGDVPYVDENGNRFWLSPSGEWVREDANAWRYVWVERWSEEHKRPYFYNQETKQSSWSRPVDLAWQRVHVTEASRALAPKRPAVAAAAGLDAAAAAGAAEGNVRQAATQAAGSAAAA